MTGQNARDDLHDKIDALNTSQVYRVSQYVDALTRSLFEGINPESSLVTTSWLEEFRSRIQAHHAVNIAPLTRTTFEDAFAAACEAAGSDTLKSESATNRFWDIAVDHSYYSLKTTAAKNISHYYLHISKLTEAAWIQDQRTASGRRDKTLELFHEFRYQVKSIFMLRGFKNDDLTVSRYELVEIPGTLFDPIFQVPVTEFNADGPKIKLPYGSITPDLEIRIDRSDAKVTIGQIQRESCIVHGTWDFPPAA
ncbi:hypothetical protein [Actinopolyspora mzabensis]|uniref:hypothetical protein n=1 Tax=Actinopolyspora mzabensis TaxID=995066 RepID=UPI00115FA899|nr:hypothetical protein [Actinopolyspora mzabensis]